jgi:curved DNA-binding protein CbpA
MTRRLHSHYDTLRVDRGASPEHVRTAYRRLAQKFHPDKHSGKSAAALVMAEINQAYEVLSDTGQRAAYDSWLDVEDSRSRGDAAAAVFTPDRFGWAGWLLFATTLLAVLTVGYVVLATWWPAPGKLHPPQAAFQLPAASDRGAGTTSARAAGIDEPGASDNPSNSSRETR